NPEILLEVFRYFEPRELFPCVMTCWTWARYAVPLLWRDAFYTFTEQEYDELLAMNIITI
ncbi:13712_t:CDS:1, partial [Racocetra persica]